MLLYNLISAPLGGNRQDSVLGQLGLDRLRVGAVRNWEGLGELPRRHHGPSAVPLLLPAADLHGAAVFAHLDAQLLGRVAVHGNRRQLDDFQRFASGLLLALAPDFSVSLWNHDPE